MPSRNSKFWEESMPEVVICSNFDPRRGVPGVCTYLGWSGITYQGHLKSSNTFLVEFVPRGTLQCPKAEKCLFQAKNRRFAEISVQKFRPGGVRSGRKNFLNYKIALLSPKKISWSYENFKFVSQKSWGGEKKAVFPPSPTFFTRIQPGLRWAE